MRIYEIEQKQPINEAVWLAPLLVGAARFGGRALINTLRKQGSREIAKKSAQNAKRAAGETAKAIGKAPKAMKDIGVGVGAGSAGIAAWEIADILGDAYYTLKEVFSEIELAEIASIVKSYGIPALAVIGAIYGGYKLVDYVSDQITDEEKNAS